MADEYLWVEGVRSFGQGRYIPIRPLTILVGENSSGKSTVLASHRLAWDVVTPYRMPRFNEDPFYLGAYDEIVSAHIAHGMPTQHMSIGVMGSSVAALTHRRHSGWMRSLGVVCQFTKGDVQPEISIRRVFSGDFKVEIRSIDTNFAEMEFAAPSGKLIYEVPSRGGRDAQYLIHYASELMADITNKRRTLFPEINEAEVREEGSITQAHRNQLGELGNAAVGYLGPAPRYPGSYAVAPVRTKPQRTYNPIVTQSEPEGGHIPLLLARQRYAADKKEGKKLIAAIAAFGKASGMFDGLDVRRLGKTESSPFQIYVKMGRSRVNLIDVGYGISQALPIIVETLQNSYRTLLLQQPEVHLHPRAQAELASFLAAAVGASRRFVIETHSDHFIDRIRMDIRDGKGIRADQVLLLYVARNGRESVVYPIEIDELGNLISVPDSYREFFRREEMRLLGG